MEWSNQQWAYYGGGEGLWIGTPVSPCVIVRPLGFCAYLYPNIGLFIGFAEIDIYDGRLHQTLQTTGAPDAYGIQETNQTNIALTFFLNRFCRSDW